MWTTLMRCKERKKKIISIAREGTPTLNTSKKGEQNKIGTVNQRTQRETGKSKNPKKEGTQGPESQQQRVVRKNTNEAASSWAWNLNKVGKETSQSASKFQKQKERQRSRNEHGGLEAADVREETSCRA